MIAKPKTSSWKRSTHVPAREFFMVKNPCCYYKRNERAAGEILKRNLQTIRQESKVRKGVLRG